MANNRQDIIQHLQEKHEQFSSMIKNTSTWGNPVNRHLDIIPGTFLAGGCITSLLLGEEPQDYDFFVSDMDLMDTIVAAFKRVGGAREDPHSITVFKHGVKFQLITSLHGPPEDVIDEFDFVHCKNYFGGEHLCLNKDALEATLYKELLFTGYGGNSTLIRIARFLQRGWTIKNSTYLQMLKECPMPEFKSAEVAKDYLT